MIFFNLAFLFIFFYFLLHHKACGILVPQPGIEPKTLEEEVWSPNQWITREFLEDGV